MTDFIAGTHGDFCECDACVFGLPLDAADEQDFLDENLADMDDDEHEWPDEEPREDQFLTDAEADADVLRSAGWGTDEDYGYYGEDDPWE